MLDQATLRQLVREVIAEEVGRLKHDHCRETIRIETDQDLTAFAKRILKLDAAERAAFESGRLAFTLERGQGTAKPTSAASRIEKGLVTEKQVDALPKGTTTLHLGKAARLTPLAKDRLRQRQIVIERS
jgi:ethanolamine utilization cobalamin adenosyltransferase